MIGCSARRLAKLCTALRTGRSTQGRTAEDDLELMRNLVQKYGDFPQSSTEGDAHTPSPETGSSGGKTIVSIPKAVLSHVFELTPRMGRFSQGRLDPLARICCSYWPHSRRVS